VLFIWKKLLGLEGLFFLILGGKLVNKDPLDFSFIAG
jgi:hypothetical protein